MRLFQENFTAPGLAALLIFISPLVRSSPEFSNRPDVKEAATLRTEALNALHAARDAAFKARQSRTQAEAQTFVSLAADKASLAVSKSQAAFERAEVIVRTEEAAMEEAQSAREAAFATQMHFRGRRGGLALNGSLGAKNIFEKERRALENSRASLQKARSFKVLAGDAAAKALSALKAAKFLEENQRLFFQGKGKRTRGLCPALFDI